MNEYDLIRVFAEEFMRSGRFRNELFMCDAELVWIGDQLWALTIDEFSPEEDLFTSDDPEALGANLATATLSDLLAAGADPQFFMHAVSLPKDVSAAFVTGLASGIKSVLEMADCALCGGDMGSAETWRFCGFAMGPVPDNRPLTHVLRGNKDDPVSGTRLGQPPSLQTLWVTGELGDANLAVIEGEATPRFELRLEEAELIRRYGTACIDTSGGFMDAVWLLHTLNPGIHIEIDLEAVPLAAGIAEFAERSGVPGEAALLGGAGEYELLFTVPVTLAESTQSELACAAATRVGTVRPDAEPGVYICRDGKPVSVMTVPPPCPREAATVADHTRDVMHMALKLFDPGGK